MLPFKKNCITINLTFTYLFSNYQYLILSIDVIANTDPINKIVVLFLDITTQCVNIS